eukprot:g4704.t1
MKRVFNLLQESHYDEVLTEAAGLLQGKASSPAAQAQLYTAIGLALTRKADAAALRGKAEAAFKRALTLDPTSLVAMQGQEELHSSADGGGDPAKLCEALAKLRTATKGTKKERAYSAKLGKALAQAGRTAEAVDVWKRVLEIDREAGGGGGAAAGARRLLMPHVQICNCLGELLAALAGDGCHRGSQAAARLLALANAADTPVAIAHSALVFVAHSHVRNGTSDDARPLLERAEVLEEQENVLQDARAARKCLDLFVAIAVADRELATDHESTAHGALRATLVSSSEWEIGAGPAWPLPVHIFQHLRPSLLVSAASIRGFDLKSVLVAAKLDTGCAEAFGALGMHYRNIGDPPRACLERNDTSRELPAAYNKTYPTPPFV